MSCHNAQQNLGQSKDYCWLSYFMFEIKKTRLKRMYKTLQSLYPKSTSEFGYHYILNCANGK